MEDCLLENAKHRITNILISSQLLFKKSLFTRLNMYRLIYTGGTILFHQHVHSIKKHPTYNKSNWITHGPSVCGLCAGQTPVCRVHSDLFFINLMSERRGSVSTQQTGTSLFPLSSMNAVFISMNNKNGAKYWIIVSNFFFLMTKNKPDLRFLFSWQQGFII